MIEKVQNLNKTLKLLEKDKKIKDALFKLTHEIKNPLAVCKGYLEIIDIDKKEKSEKYINIMREEIDRSLNIMSDFIQFNKIKIEKKKTNINKLLEDIYSSFTIVAKTNNIKIDYTKEEKLLLKSLLEIPINIKVKQDISSIKEVLNYIKKINKIPEIKKPYALVHISKNKKKV